MVQNGIQKSKSKASSRKAALSKKPVKELPKTVASNGCSDSEEPQNATEMSSAVESKATVSGNQSENVAEIDSAQSVVSEVNGKEHVINEAEMEIPPEVAKQPIKSQKRKAAVVSKTENSKMVSEKEDGKSALPPSKRKGRQKKETKTKMETAEDVPDNQQVTNEPVAESSAEPIQPPSRTRKRKAAEDVKTEEAAETVENEAEPESVESSLPLTKSRKRNAKTEKSQKILKSSKEIKSKAVPTTKAKRQKVVLNIPAIKRISGKVFVIGENDVGQLGLEGVEVKKRPAMLDLPHTFVEVVAGGMHSVCLTENGEIITFGCNDEGALGRITTDESQEGTPLKVDIPERVVQISAGDSHSAALTESGKVYLWGNFRCGDGPMGLTPDGAKQVKPIRILNGVTIVKISSGTEHLVCLSNEGTVYTLGCGENGQLGRLSERMSRDGGRKGRANLLEPAEVPVMSRFKKVPIEDIFAGSYVTFLKAQDSGSIYAFGLNNYGQLGYKMASENESFRFLPKEILSFNNASWSQITGGQHHTLVLDSTGLVYALGRKDYGRLGLGENCEEKSEPTGISTLQNEKCTEVSCGNCVSFAVTEEGFVYSWGFGTNHQLGHGNDDDCHVPQRIEGNFSNSWKAHKVSGGGQHTLILACPKENLKSDKKK